MGGKSHVRCMCRQFPLIPTHRLKAEKKKCNLKCYIGSNNVQVDHAHSDCQRIEAYICSNPSCNTRVCRRCYSALPTTDKTMILPNNTDVEDDNNCANNAEIIDNDLASEHNDNGSSTSKSTDYNHEASIQSIESDILEKMNNHVVTSAQDSTLDLTEDNYGMSVGFNKTDIGDIPMSVNKASIGHTVSGHVIFNQAGQCVSHWNGNIYGTSRQKY